MEQKRVSWFQGWFGIGLVLAITVPAVVLSWLTLNMGTVSTIPSAVNKLIAQECAGQELGACLQSQLGYVIFCNDSSLLFTCTLLPPPPVKRKRAAMCTSGPCWVLSGTLAAIGGPGMTIAPCPPSIPCTPTTNGMNVYCNAFSVSPAAPGEVYVCVNPSYVLMGSLVGGAGATGPSGPQGAEGASGSVGTTGAIGGSGSQGQAGVAGATGATGTNGLAGGQGAAGSAGASGTTGAPGPEGSIGSSGASGDTGAEGSAGSNGDTGVNGAPGSLGTAGTLGASGDTGVSGATGATGTLGEDGTAGTGGPDGSLGTNGGSGATGNSGATGSQGSAGQSGSAGASGVTGSEGTMGATGATGNEGIAGETGATGAPGQMGTTGATGPTGNLGGDGATGGLGPSGAIGLEGTSGATGSLGTSGQEGSTGGTGVLGGGGATGAGGAAGASGSVGSSGSSGALGETGSAGENGASGGLGASGPSGSTGGPGPTGSTGSEGGSGGSGATGIVGGTGSSGASGATGITGATGARGGSGSSGETGASGSRPSTGAAGSTGSSGPIGLTASLLINYFTQPTAGSVSVNVANSIASTDYFVLFAHIRGGTTTLSSETPNAAAAPAFNPNRTTFTFPSITLAVNDTFVYRLYDRSNTVGTSPIGFVKKQYTAQFCFLLAGYGTNMCWDTTTQNYCTSVYPFQEGVTGTIFNTFGNVAAYINSTNAFVSPSGVNGGCWFEFPQIFTGSRSLREEAELQHYHWSRAFHPPSTLNFFPVNWQLRVTTVCNLVGNPQCDSFTGLPIIGVPATYSGTWNMGDGTADRALTAGGTTPFATAGTHVLKIAGRIDNWSVLNQPSGNMQSFNIGIPQIGNVLTGVADFNRASTCLITDVGGTQSPDLLTTAQNMLQFCQLNTLSTDTWTLNSLTGPIGMFRKSATVGSLTSMNLQNFRGPVATQMFLQTGASGLRTFNVTNWRMDVTTNLGGTALFNTAINVDVAGWRWNGASTSLASVFSGAGSITALAVRNWDVDNVQNFASTFQSCTSLVGLDVSIWNTRSATTFSSTFQSMTATGALASPNVISWNTTRVTTTASMFQSTNLMNPTVTFWNLPALTTCAGMFQLTAGSLPILSLWNTPVLTTAASMFTGASNTGALQAAGWQAPALQILTSMFQSCAYASVNLTGTSFPAATNMVSMFEGTGTQIIGWPSGRNNPSLTTTSRMFYGYTRSAGLPSFTGWTATALLDMSFMFAATTSPTLTCTGLPVTNATNVGAMFQYTTSTVIDISGLNFAAATNLNAMFETTTGGGVALTINATGTTCCDRALSIHGMFASEDTSVRVKTLIGVDTFTFPLVTNAQAVLYGARTPGTALDLRSWGMGSATTFLNMFAYSKVGTVNVTGWNTGQVTSMSFLCGSVIDTVATNPTTKFIGLDTWDTSKVTTMQNAFSLHSGDILGVGADPIGVGAWNVGAVTSFHQMFSACGSCNPSFANWRPTAATTVSNMINQISLSTAHYDEFLVAFATYAPVGLVNQNPGTIAPTKYSNVTARNILIGRGWTLNDGGLATKRDDPNEDPWSNQEPTSAPTTGSWREEARTDGPKGDDFMLVRFGKRLYNYLFA
jgi:surface protein